MRIGILGGSFDPVHHGHLGVAGMAAESLGLDRVWLMPAARAPLRTEATRASGPQRLRMLHLALEEWRERTGESRLEVCELELERGGVSYTAATLRALAEKHPGVAWTWIVGEDQWTRLGSWREPETLAALARWAVYARPGHEGGPAPCVPGLRVDRVPAPQVWAESSTEIRERLAAGRDAAGLLPDKVIEYIRRNGLYGAV